MKIDPGMRLGPYEIIGLLGQGGMGEVYRARDARLSREVAIKLLPADYSADQDRLRRFEQEARSTGMLNHPNILSVFDFGTENGSPYIVSELLEGKTLREILKESKLSQRKAIDYGLQIANGLAAAHEKGIIHRDLKPENIFVTNDGRVKILDFGLAKLKQPDVPKEQLTQAPTMTRNTAEGIIFGTVGYMSPEQVRASALDHRSDIFTFGAILFEMLNGKRAFEGTSNIEALNAILKEDPFESSETGTIMNPALQGIIRHCLEKNPSERFQSARDLAFHLQTISSANTISSPAHAESKKLKPLKIYLGIAAALALALAIGFLMGRRFVATQLSKQKVSALNFQALTQRRGYLTGARFAPDGNSVIYSASWDGTPVQLFTTRPESPESSALPLPAAGIFAISSKGEMAIALNCEISGYSGSCPGTLATVPIAGGAPREIMENVMAADWSPDGKDLMVAINAGKGSHVEYPLGKIIYKSPGNILFARLSPTGDRIAFFESQISDYSLVMIDLNGHKKLLSSGWGRGTGLCWKKNSNEIWVSGPRKEAATSITGVDTEGHERIVLRTPSGLRLNDISQDGRVLLTSNFGRVQLVAFPPNSSKEVEVSWFTNSHPADLSDDGKNLLLTDLRSGRYGVYLRKTDGSPAVLLGLDGEALALSPDQKWAVARSGKGGGGLVFFPTGPGQPKYMKIDWDKSEDFAQWFPDSSRIMFDYAAHGHNIRAWSIDIRTSKCEPLTPEGVEGYLISPDGKTILVSDETGKFSMIPVGGNSSQPVNVLQPDDIPIQWADDGHSVFVVKEKRIFESIDRVDLVTGRRVVVKDIRPTDPAGVIFSVGYPRITPDGKVYTYGYNRVLGDLFLANGLQ